MTSSTDKITWTNERRKLSELKPWPRNPRQIKQDQAKRLSESFDTFGQVETIAVGPDDEIYNGHQRLNVLSHEYGDDYEVEVRVSSRPLTEKEREKLTVFLHQGTTGEWNFDMLANEFDLKDLLDWGFSREGLGLADDISDDRYTRNIEAPIYIPSQEKPSIQDLFDTSKTDELIIEIHAADIPDDEKEFLIAAARRHTVFNYKNIAEYYSHSPQAIQDLFEKSALVIIDFERAIELGYVKLSKKIASLYSEDYDG